MSMAVDKRGLAALPQAHHTERGRKTSSQHTQRAPGGPKTAISQISNLWPINFQQIGRTSSPLSQEKQRIALQ